jgi:hypothetical protein
MKARGQWQGMMTIARFNWPFYAVAIAVLIASLAGLFLISNFELKLVCGIALAGAAYFIFVSLGVSYLIYDRSDLYRWGWLDRALREATKRHFIFCHSGFDDALAGLRENLGDAVGWRVLDHFDPRRMTAASIRRARRMFPPGADTLTAPFNQWPVEAESADVVFGILAIHELRSEAERSSWFAEAKRCLRANGRVVLVEHVRNSANLLAFGPGCLHFHSRASWRRAWERAEFHSLDEFRLTPWVRVFVLCGRDEHDHDLGAIDANSAQRQTSERNTAFKMTIPTAEISKSPARRISRVFIPTIAPVCTTAQASRSHPVKTQIPNSTSSNPIAFVALQAILFPRILPTINWCRGIPSRILL